MTNSQGRHAHAVPRLFSEVFGVVPLEGALWRRKLSPFPPLPMPRVGPARADAVPRRRPFRPDVVAAEVTFRRVTVRTGQKRRGGGKMAAPEERDLTQEQTEKLLQFQVAASTRCNECCRGLGSGSLEEPRTLLRLGPRFVSNQQTAPSPPAANCPARCPRPPNLCLSPAFQGWLRPDLPSLSLIRGSALQVLLSGARPQPSFPTRILGPSPPTTLDPLRCLIPTVELASFRASVRAFHQFPMPFLQTFIEDFRCQVPCWALL